MKPLVMAAFAVFIAFSTSADVWAKTGDKSDVENNKRMARVWFDEIIVKENLKPLDTIMDKNATMTMDPSYPSKVSGTSKLAGLKQIKDHVKGFTDIAETKGEVIDLIGEGNTVMLFRTVSMKTPRGSSVDVPWVTIFKFNNGKINQITHVHDTLHEKNQNEKK